MLGFMLAAALTDPPAADFRRRELLSSVTISGTCTLSCPRTQRLLGTGEIVGRRANGELIVLTARHVVADMTAPRVYVRNEMPEGTYATVGLRERRGRRAQVIAESSQTDLALVGFFPAPADAYAVATFAADGRSDRGDIVGDPNGALWTVSPYRAIAADGEAQLVDCETCGPGDSGGGVFDRRGELAGILVSQQVFVAENESLKSATRSSHFKIVPLADLRTFVASVPAQPAVLAAPGPYGPWSRFDQTRFNQAPVERASVVPPVTAPTTVADPWSRFAAQRAPANP